MVNHLRATERDFLWGHQITRHPTQVNALTPVRQANIRFLPTSKGAGLAHQAIYVP